VSLRTFIHDQGVCTKQAVGVRATTEGMQQLTNRAEQRHDCLDADVMPEPDQDIPCERTGGDFLDAFARSQTELKASFESL
jgi:hypothetical protein